MLLGGWRKRDILDIYSDITLKDIETKQLKRAGLLKENNMTIKEKKPLKIKICTKCKYSNSPTSRFCNKCGRILDSRSILEVEAKEKLIEIDQSFDVQQQQKGRKRPASAVADKEHGVYDPL